MKPEDFVDLFQESLAAAEIPYNRHVFNYEDSSSMGSVMDAIVDDFKKFPMYKSTWEEFYKEIPKGLEAIEIDDEEKREKYLEILSLAFKTFFTISLKENMQLMATLSLLNAKYGVTIDKEGPLSEHLMKLHSFGLFSVELFAAASDFKLIIDHEDGSLKFQWGNVEKESSVVRIAEEYLKELQDNG